MSQPYESTVPRTRTSVIVVAVVAQLLGLLMAAYCFFLATLMTYGLYSWQEPQLDGRVWLPILGFAVALSLGSWAMTLGAHPRRWRWIACGVMVGGAVVLSLLTWVSVLLR